LARGAIRSRADLNPIFSDSVVDFEVTPADYVWRWLCGYQEDHVRNVCPIKGPFKRTEGGLRVVSVLPPAIQWRTTEDQWNNPAQSN